MDSISHPFRLPERFLKIAPEFVIKFQSYPCGSLPLRAAGCRAQSHSAVCARPELCVAGLRAVLEVVHSLPITSSGHPSRSVSLPSFVFGVSAPSSVDTAWWPVAHIISLVSALRAASQAGDCEEGGWVALG